MILESAQLLSTAHRVIDGKEIEVKKYVDGSIPAKWRNTKSWVLNDERETTLYKATHINHPSAVWARSNIDHYRYLYDLFIYLMDEYTYRYGKVHKCEQMIGPLFASPAQIDFEHPWSEPPQAMPDECKVVNDAVSAYRNYYNMHKYKLAKWTKRKSPDWFSKHDGT